MQYKRKKNVDEEKKKILLTAIGKIIHEKRKATGKGILLHSYEFDLSSNSLERIEKGLRDPQITTLWKIVNSLGIDFKEFINILYTYLPENFNLTDE